MSERSERGPSGPAAGQEGPITLGDRWTYDWAARKKPAIHPVRTPAGHVLTRMAPPDHPWHRALWFTIKYVNEENFWEEQRPYGVLRHVDEPEQRGPDDAGRTSLTGTIRWIRPDQVSVAFEERRRLTHVPLGDDAYAIDLDVSLRATEDTTIRSEPFTTWGGYGGLSVRGRPDWHDTRLLLADGSTHERVIADRSPWCDLSGPIGGTSPSGEEGDDAVGGLAILDHPGNDRHPVPWYGSTRAATYGDEGWSNFLNAAFLFEEPLTIPAGERLLIRHRVVVHDGWWDADRVGSAWDAYVNEAKDAAVRRRAAGG